LIPWHRFLGSFKVKSKEELRNKLRHVQTKKTDDALSSFLSDFAVFYAIHLLGIVILMNAELAKYLFTEDRIQFNTVV
jgi:hypothetical protein